MVFTFGAETPSTPFAPWRRLCPATSGPPFHRTAHRIARGGSAGSTCGR